MGDLRDNTVIQPNRRETLRPLKALLTPEDSDITGAVGKGRQNCHVFRTFPNLSFVYKLHSLFLNYVLCKGKVRDDSSF